MKRSMLILLAVLMLLLAPATQLRANAAETGTCGENLTWALDGGTLTISGTGPMYEYEYLQDIPWNLKAEYIQRIVLEEGVTTISHSAFSDCTALTSITIPGSVTRIGTFAFNKCTALRSITIPEGVTTIDDYTFYNCNMLRNVTIPEGVTTIGKNAFLNCRSIPSITIPASVTSIGESAFRNCDKLRAVHYMGTEAQKAAISIGSNNFGLDDAQWHYECIGANCEELSPGEKSGICGDGLTWILDDSGTLTISGEGAMYDYSVESPAPWYPRCEEILSIVLESGITSIGDSAFRECIYASRITIPSGVITIGQQAFYQCSSLSSIPLPASIIHIGDFAFAECVSLSSITIPEGVTSISRSTFFCCIKLSSVTIPDSVTSIGDSAFYGCGLKTITIPDSVTSIGISAFDFCSDLSLINIPDGVTSIGERTFSCCESLSSITIGNGVTTIGDFAFYGCESLTEIHIPDSVTSIGKSAFDYCTHLNSITIPGSVTSIREGTFSECTRLTSVTLPVSVTSIGDSAFYSCTNLRVVHHIGTEAQAATVSIGSGNADLEAAQWHYECVGATCPFMKIGTCGDKLVWILDDAGILTISGTGSMDKYTSQSHASWYSHRANIQSVVVEEGVSTIGEYAFYECTKVTAVTLPVSVTSIRDFAFESCIDLTDVYYAGTEEQKAKISISTGNSYLQNAQWHCVIPRENPFVDIAEGDYYYDPILWAVEKGITNGMSANTFAPDATCTRGQVVTFLWRANGCPKPTRTDNPFTDVKSSDYYYDAIIWAVETGITSGMGGTTFAPDAECTRGQVATFLWRAKGSPQPKPTDNPFSDVKSSDYYYDPIIWALENNITSGMGGSKFAPDIACTRGQIVTFLYRAFK